MKSIALLVLLVGVCVAQQNPTLSVGSSEEVCHDLVESACGRSSSVQCTASYGGIKHTLPELQAYTNSQLTKSYEYLLLATYFNSYQKDRPGFNKLFQGLSDRSFDDTIDLIKQITKRGGIVDFNVKHETKAYIPKSKKSFEVSELHSLALSLDFEKALTRGAIHVHNHALHASEVDKDPEIAHYIEEKFLGKQADTVRKLSGYANDLSKMLKQDDPALATYLFDEYLQKQ